MKEKKKSIENRGWKSKSKIVLGIMLLSFAAAGILYAVMLQTEKKLLDGGEKRTVAVAKKMIPKGIVLDEENWDEFVELKEVDVSLIPHSAIKEMIEESLVVAWSVEEGAFLTEGFFDPLMSVISELKEPVLAGFRADDLYQVVGGVLRAGDRIHVYRVDRENQEVKLLWENLFVQQVFDNGGARIESGDEKTSAQRVNIYLEQETVEEFYEELSKGEVRVVKAL